MIYPIRIRIKWFNSDGTILGIVLSSLGNLVMILLQAFAYASFIVGVHWLFHH